MKILNILVRRYLPLEDLDQAVAFHEKLIGQTARLRFDYPEHDLRLAQVASILFVAGTEQSLKPFTATHLTFMVDDIDAFAAHLPPGGVIALAHHRDDQAETVHRQTPVPLHALAYWLYHAFRAV